MKKKEKKIACDDVNVQSLLYHIYTFKKEIISTYIVRTFATFNFILFCS